MQVAAKPAAFVFTCRHGADPRFLQRGRQRHRVQRHRQRVSQQIKHRDVRLAQPALPGPQSDGQLAKAGALHPGYRQADQIGHRRLQVIGFAMMATCFLTIAAVPGMTTTVAPFLLVYGISYFFTEFGPNMTTFVLPSELYPVSMRTTGSGMVTR
jgi:sugar transport protein